MESKSKVTSEKHFETLLFQVSESGVGLITLNRPERLNALSLKMVEELYELLHHLDGNREIRVIIITGAGRGFCSGADLSDEYLLVPSIQEGAASHLEIIQRKYSGLIVKMRTLPQIIIAAVNGPAAGGGMCMALAADIVYAGPDATFVNSFINIGLSGGELGSSWLLPRLVGSIRAAEIIYTGRTVDAKEADRIGLVSRLIKDKRRLVEAAMETALILTQKNPVGLRQTKKVLNRNMDSMPFELAIEMEDLNQSICVSMPEIRRAARKFRRKSI
ncbi:MAG: putative enoyl-CoA hydratase echA8 [Syntrophus sp. PtaB.Bin138]|nr:MAG: putative enoyl-CoA hydratase echA8 [Syntrophus sp. PtaB.Bin138]